MKQDRDWKAAYAEQLQESGQREEAWETARENLEQSIVALAGAAWGRDAELDVLLRTLREDARNSVDAETLLQTARLARDHVLSELATDSDSPEQAAWQLANGQVTLSVSGSILGLFDSIDLPAAAHRQLETLRSRLAQDHAISPDTLVRELGSLLRALRKGMLSEKQAFQTFLAGITARIDQFHQRLLTLLEQQQQPGPAGVQLKNSFNTQLTAMRSSVEHARDLESLKASVRSGIDQVEGVMESFLSADTRHRAQLQDELKALGSALVEVQEQAARLQAELADAQKRATTDGLTGLSNRVTLDERLAQEVNRWERHGHALSVVIVDVDHFKRINDQYGHQTGDRVLRELAKRLRKLARKEDTVGRYGGEEFVLVLPDTDLEKARTVAEKARALVGRLKFKYEGAPIPLTISAGAAQALPDESIESLIGRADQALYRAKEGGRNQVVAAD